MALVFPARVERGASGQHRAAETGCVTFKPLVSSSSTVLSSVPDRGRFLASRLLL